MGELFILWLRRQFIRSKFQFGCFRRFAIHTLFLLRCLFLRLCRFLKTLKDHNIDLVVLAGFLSVLGPSVIEAYPRRILNVHPALIPSFCGPGMYGLRPHEAALARGCKVTGATVHFVNEECDGGPILLQKAVDILPGDTPEVLQKRVMEQAEWKLLPKAVAMVCSGEIE